MFGDLVVCLSYFCWIKIIIVLIDGKSTSSLKLTPAEISCHKVVLIYHVLINILA